MPERLRFGEGVYGGDRVDLQDMIVAYSERKGTEMVVRLKVGILNIDGIKRQKIRFVNW